MKPLLGAAFHLIPHASFVVHSCACSYSFQEILHANSFPASFTTRVGANDNLCSRGNRPSSDSTFYLGATQSRALPAETRSTRDGL